ncbi:CBASS oligonucleotide cyclase [Nostoc sp.]|uniref:CBASS oligonucleotide cyclase n=1 Tax=Nostoc sp. TaxID=1180 RepID=UPI002FFBD712
MGGSGGGFFPNPDINRQLRESETETRNQQFESEVSGIINSLLADYNNRDGLVIQGHLDAIKSALEQEIDGTVDILYGGSVAKHTYVDGISDIDALVLIDKSELKDKSPAEVKKYFFERLQVRLPRTKIGQGNLAVTVEFRDSEIQLLPAIRHESGFKIADFTGNNWSAIKPIEFTSLLTGINQNIGGKVVPTIKLAKSIISELPENQRLSGYHVEAIAVEVFQKYQGSKKSKDMLKYFFDEASRQVLRSIRDTTGQSMHVDDYLGSVNSPDRNRISKSLDRISRRMKNADGAQSIDQWRDILD